jgi:tetratricopeptide (TPR) repeat protein
MGLVVILIGLAGTLMNFLISGSRLQSIVLLAISVTFAVFAVVFRIRKAKTLLWVVPAVYIVVLCAGGMLLPDMNPQDRIQEAVLKSASQMNAGKIEDAGKTLADIMREYPDDPLLNKQFTKVCINRKNTAAAEISVEKALKYMGNDETLWLDKGLLQLQLKQTDKAVECFEKSADLNPGYYEASLYAGITCLQLKDLRKAIYYLDNARICRRIEAKPYYYLGLAYTELMQYEDAGTLLTQAVKLYGKDTSSAKEAAELLEYVKAMQRGDAG